jgi:hypothetical protein
MTPQTTPDATGAKPVGRLYYGHQARLFHPAALQELRGIVARALLTAEDAELLQIWGKHLIARSMPEDAERAYLEPRTFRDALDALRPFATCPYSTERDVVRFLEVARNASCEPRLVSKRALDVVITDSPRYARMLAFAGMPDVWSTVRRDVLTLRCALEALDACDFTERGVRAGIWSLPQDVLVDRSLRGCTAPGTWGLSVWGARGHTIVGRDIFVRSPAVSDERWERLFGGFAREGLPTIVEGEELGAARRDVDLVREMAQKKPPWPDKPDACARFDRDLGELGEMVERAAQERLAVVEWVTVMKGR